MGVCNCSMFCCTLLYVHSSIGILGQVWYLIVSIPDLCNLTYFVIILIEKRELVGLLSLSSWCLVMVEWLFLAMPWGCLRFVSVLFPDHTYLLF